jgi:transglutaminase-like putative cysteine protease
MRLKAGCDLRVETQEETPLVAMLRPRSGEGQWIANESYALEPFVNVVEYVDSFGNLCQRLVAPKGAFRLRVEAEVETADTITTAAGAPFVPVQELPDSALVYLLPSRYCPSDMLVDQAQGIVQGQSAGYDQVEAIRAWIHANIEYKYGVSNGSTDARDTLQMRAGVCRDYAHVGMSLCRALKIPARMVVGWLYRLDPMDMHAWFEAYVGGRWYTFDATQREPRGGRIAVAYGRDAADVALTTEYAPIQIADMKVWVERADGGSNRA